MESFQGIIDNVKAVAQQWATVDQSQRPSSLSLDQHSPHQSRTAAGPTSVSRQVVSLCEGYIGIIHIYPDSGVACIQVPMFSVPCLRYAYNSFVTRLDTRQVESADAGESCGYTAYTPTIRYCRQARLYSGYSPIELLQS